MRHWQWLRTRPATTLLAGTAAIAIAGLGAHLWGQQSQAWTHEPAQQQYTSVRADVPSCMPPVAMTGTTPAAVKACYFGPEDATHTAVLMGDSVAGQWFPAMMEVFRRPGWRLLVLTKSPAPWWTSPSLRTYRPRVHRVHRLAQCRDCVPPEQAGGPGGDRASAAARSPLPMEQGTARVLQALAPAAKKLVVLQPTPVLPFDGPACLSRAQWRAPLLDSPAACTSPPVNDRAAPRSPKTPSPGPSSTMTNAHEALDMVDYVCPGDTCRAAHAKPDRLPRQPAPDGQLRRRPGQAAHQPTAAQRMSATKK